MGMDGSMIECPCTENIGDVIEIEVVCQKTGIASPQTHVEHRSYRHLIRHCGDTVGQSGVGTINDIMRVFQEFSDHCSNCRIVLDQQNSAVAAIFIGHVAYSSPKWPR
jgi:hypothetical protein